MTRRQAIATTLGALLSSALAGRASAVSDAVYDYTGWTFYDMTDTWFETRVNISQVKEWAWTQTFQFRKQGDAMVLNPDFEEATHHVLFAIMPDGCPAFAVAPRVGFQGAVVPSGPTTEEGLFRILAKARKEGKIPAPTS